MREDLTAAGSVRVTVSIHCGQQAGVHCDGKIHLKWVCLAIGGIFLQLLQIWLPQRHVSGVQLQGVTGYNLLALLSPM